MPPKTTPSRQPEIRRGRTLRISDRSKRAGKRRQRRRKSPLKGWLATPADWARFDAWAKINALPRKIAEPETIMRESKPLSYFKKRLVVLAEPTSTKFDTESICRMDLSVSKSALTAKPSKRIRELAKFARRYVEPCKEMPNPISKAALRYKASRRIIQMSQPIPDEFEECKTLEVSRNALKHKTTNRENEMSLAKRVESCPNTFSDEERRKLYTPDGVRKSALSYKINDWISILALPSYRFLKDRRDAEARKMKKQLEENEDRGSKVVDEKRRKQEKKARKGSKKSKNKRNNSRQQSTEEDEADSNTDADEKRRRKKQAWRKEPGPCRERPLDVSKAALKAKASARTEEIAKPHNHESQSCRANPFAVRKSALSGKASSRTEEIAKPVNPLDPVEKAPPRETDEFGAPIFPKPKYGKVLPKVKPYKMGKCKDNEEKQKPGRKRRRKMRPIALFPSIDPYLDPNGAEKQAKARKIARKK